MPNYFSKEFILRNKFSFLISLVLLASFIIENINHRFWLNDFRVYYTAADHLLHGGNIYNEAFGLGSGFYKYSPFAAFFFIPFTFLPYYTATVVYYFIISALIIYVLHISLALITRYYGNENSFNPKNQIILLFVFIATVVHLQRELHLGNVNILLLALILLSIKKILEDKIMLPAILLAIVILFKPHFIIFLPLLILRKRFMLSSQIILFILIGLALPTFFIGYQSNINLHSQWFSTMRSHNSGILQAKQTIYFILYHYILRFIMPEPNIIYLLIILLLTGASVLLYIMRHNKSKTIHQNLLLEFLLLLALIPSLTLTDTEHFLLTLPLITLLIYQIRTTKRSRLYLILFTIAILCYSANIHDLLGSNLSAYVLLHGFLGIGNLILIVLYYSSTFQSNQREIGS